MGKGAVRQHKTRKRETHRRVRIRLSPSRSAYLVHQLASDTLKALHDHGGRPFALLRNDIHPAVQVDLDVLSQ